MMPSILAIAAVLLAGAISHEIAHWVVWRASGRQPLFDLFELQVCPRAGPRTTTLSDRIAAGAPYVVGSVALVTGALSGFWVVTLFGVGMVQIPSRVDVETMMGKTAWRIH